VNHEEEKLPNLIDDLPKLLGRYQGNGTRLDYLSYPLKLHVQNNNNTRGLESYKS
jgi:hypothetical protein